MKIKGIKNWPSLSFPLDSLVRLPLHHAAVVFLAPVARVRQRVQPSVVVGEEQHACRVPVQPPHRQQPRPLGAWHKIYHCGPTFASNTWPHRRGIRDEVYVDTRMWNR